GLNMRVEHTHCFSDHGVGGHYHEDTTPEEVEYEGYFNLAETLYRIDQPHEVFDFGKD
ncbi:Ester hydrolase C11orf54, partial [Araneus ventricosus]